MTEVRRLDIGFLPGAVFLLEGAVRDDVPRIKAAMQEACEDPLEFRDSDFYIEQNADALCGYPDGTGHVAILTRPGLNGTERTLALVHECLHATFTVLRNAGVKPGKQSEELYAYLLEHLVAQALDPTLPTWEPR